MEEMMKVLKRKSQIIYDMNCIEKYLVPGEFDESLSMAWDNYKEELEEVEEELKLLSNPATKDLEAHKLELLHKIEAHYKQIQLIQHQIDEVDKKILVLV